MYSRTAYHMHAVVMLANGISFSDADHVFTTRSVPRTSGVQIATDGQTPQPGVELFDTVIPHLPSSLLPICKERSSGISIVVIVRE